MADPYEGPGGGGGAPPLFLDQTEDQRVEKNFFETASALDDRPLPLLSEGQGPSCSKGG